MGPVRPLTLTRREFLAGTGAMTGSALLAGCAKRAPQHTPGRIAGASAAAGHRLRDGSFPPPAETLELEAVVIGGGIAGLSAARELQRSGVSDLLLLELESSVGGNSLCGRNEVSAFPWGAHYLPLPGDDCPEVQRLLEEVGIITGRAANGAPRYDETALCADPMERLHVNGSWQEGVIPRLDTTDEDRRQIDRFLAHVDALRRLRGADGRRAFSIPVDRSSGDWSFRQWDQRSFASYLDSEGFTAPALRWYIDYCCRDDYGAGAAHVSAWAGLHYFAARDARADNAPPNAVLTWPEGNGWLAARLAEPVSGRIRAGSLVYNIDPSPAGSTDRVAVDYLDLATERSVRVIARAAICALPRFVTARIVQPWRTQPLLFAGVEYSPWMVANLTITSIDAGLGGAPAWDNVIQRSASLGYIVATHQRLATTTQETVLTYYQPLDHASPREARQQAQSRTHQDWCSGIFSDLSSAHPALQRHTRHLDVWLWGHAMVRPSPGFTWGETRRRMQEPLGRVAFAHSDMSGISLFEEAHVHGLHAAQQSLRQLRRTTRT